MSDPEGTVSFAVKAPHDPHPVPAFLAWEVKDPEEEYEDKFNIK